MKTIKYKIEFLSDWHTGSGLSAGADLDLLVIKDKNNLPFIPGKTIKGLLKDAALTLNELNAVNDQFVTEIFGKSASSKNFSIAGQGIFSNVTLEKDFQEKIIADKATKFLYRKISSTAIDKQGQAVEHSLRRLEVTIPLTLYGEIMLKTEKNYKDDLVKCMKMVKRLGGERNRGLGRCKISLIGGE